MLDNEEVLFCASENGRNYFAYGAVPFAVFTAEQYVKYKLALCGAEKTVEALSMLSMLNIPHDVRLGAIVPAQRACIDYIIKKSGGLLKERTVVDLDGVKCTRKNRKALNELIGLCPDLFVCVCDNRFLKYAKKPFTTLDFGKRQKCSRPRFYEARRLAKMISAYKIAVM